MNGPVGKGGRQWGRRVVITLWPTGTKPNKTGLNKHERLAYSGGVQAPRLGHQYSFFLSLGLTSLSMLATFSPTEDGTHSSVCVVGYHSGRRGQRWSELQPEEGALISPKGDEKG